MWGCCEPGSGCVEPVAWFELQHDSRWCLYVQKTCLSTRITLFMARRRPRALSRLLCGVRVSRARLGRVRTESVGTCRYGYCSERLATSGHGYSSHRSWYLPKVWMLRSNRVLERSRSLAPGGRTANRPIQQNVATGPKSRDEPIKKVIIWQLVPISNTPRPQRTYDGQCHDGRALRTHI